MRIWKAAGAWLIQPHFKMSVSQDDSIAHHLQFALELFCLIQPHFKMPVGQADSIWLVLLPAEAKRGVVAAYRRDALVDEG